MSHTLTITIPDQAYRTAERRAQRSQQTIEQAIAEQLIELSLVYPNPEPDPEQTMLMGEVQAYIALHPSLLQHYLGQWVAIYQGELVDHDWDEEALMLRRLQRFPEEAVLIRQVEPLSNRLKISQRPTCQVFGNLTGVDPNDRSQFAQRFYHLQRG